MRHIVPGRHDVTVTNVAFMVNNGFIQAGENGRPVSLT